MFTAVHVVDVTQEKRTPLHMAAAADDEAVVELLLQRGADVNAAIEVCVKPRMLCAMPLGVAIKAMWQPPLLGGKHACGQCMFFTFRRQLLVQANTRTASHLAHWLHLHAGLRGDCIAPGSEALLSKSCVCSCSAWCRSSTCQRGERWCT
jgi:hypothetical protein